MSNSIPSPLRDLLSKLEFLSMLKQDFKPCMHDYSFVAASSWYGAYKRSFMGEGKSDMIIQINTIIDNAINAIEEYKETEFLGLILNKLALAKIGIETLKSTYNDYPKIIADINICIDNINIQLDKNKTIIHKK